MSCGVGLARKSLLVSLPTCPGHNLGGEGEGGLLVGRGCLSAYTSLHLSVHPSTAAAEGPGVCA